LSSLVSFVSHVVLQPVFSSAFLSCKSYKTRCRSMRDKG
jgi:hypothetical protein